ncbi:hypothetical protein ACOME3_007186 [Neoechinorhynchus agilis]
MTFPKAINNLIELSKSIAISPPPGTRASSASDSPQQNDNTVQQLDKVQQLTSNDAHPMNNSQHHQTRVNDSMSLISNANAAGNNPAKSKSPEQVRRECRMVYGISQELGLRCPECDLVTVGKSRVKLFVEHQSAVHLHDSIICTCLVCDDYQCNESSVLGGNAAVKQNSAIMQYTDPGSLVFCIICRLKIYGLGQFNFVMEHLKDAHQFENIEFDCDNCCNHRPSSFILARGHFNHCIRNYVAGVNISKNL